MKLKFSSLRKHSDHHLAHRHQRCGQLGERGNFSRESEYSECLWFLSPPLTAWQYRESRIKCPFSSLYGGHQFCTGPVELGSPSKDKWSNAQAHRKWTVWWRTKTLLAAAAAAAATGSPSLISHFHSGGFIHVKHLCRSVACVIAPQMNELLLEVCQRCRKSFSRNEVSPHTQDLGMW